ncbi:MAG: hypothetical protein ABI200_03085, partial [Gaiellales bacterium]
MTLAHPTTPPAALLDAMRERAQLDDAAFTDLALELYAFQRAHVPAYDAWCRYELGARDGGEVRSWRDIPALPIAAFKQLEVAAPGSPVAAMWQSSGTTADARSSHRLQDVAHYDASLDAGVAAALVPDVAARAAAPLACLQLQPHAGDAPNSSLTHMFDRIRTGPWCRDAGSFVNGSYELDATGAWAGLTQLAEAGEPVLMLATSFALAMLLEQADEQD